MRARVTIVLSQLHILVRAIHAMDPFHLCRVKTPIASLCFITVGIQIYIRTRLLFSTVSKEAYDKKNSSQHVDKENSIQVGDLCHDCTLFDSVASLTYGVLERFLSMVYYDV